MQDKRNEPSLQQRVRLQHGLLFSNNQRGYLVNIYMQDFPCEKMLELQNTVHTMVYYFQRCFPVGHGMNCILKTLLA